MSHFVADATLFDDAAGLIAAHGARASDEAARLAALSRSDGNLVRFCRWRDVRRLLTLFAQVESAGTIH